MHIARRSKAATAIATLAPILALWSACAPKPLPTPKPAAPRFEDFIAPDVPAEFANSVAANEERRGWGFLQAGDFKSAEFQFRAALRLTPEFYPAETSLGYLELARQNAANALPHFDRALARRPNDVAGLIGRGQALLALGKQVEALGAFEQALAADPARADVGRRIDVLKFRVEEEQLAGARQLAGTGHLDDAVRAYGAAIATSPDSPLLYRELAETEQKRGDTTSALAHFRRALALDATDPRSQIGVGEILEGQNDLDGAAAAYTAALAIEPNAAVTARLAAVRSRAEVARLPEEYKAIPRSPQITRGELAALIGVHLTSLVQPTASAEAGLMTDVRTDWAATWITMVARAAVMEPFANHAFQPRAVVRRTEFAEVVSRLLMKIAADHPEAAKSWASAKVTFPDLAASHLAYGAASQAVASGVMKTDPGGAFQPSRAVSGAEAVQAMEQLQKLAGVAPR